MVWLRFFFCKINIKAGKPVGAGNMSGIQRKTPWGTLTLLARGELFRGGHHEGDLALDDFAESDVLGRELLERYDERTAAAFELLYPT